MIYPNSFMKSFFYGELREDLLFPFPKSSESEVETVSMVLDTVRKMASDQVHSAEWDEAGEMPQEVINLCSEMGLMGLAVPEEYGGLGLPQSAYCRIMEEIAGIDGSLAAMLGAHQSIGYKAVLLFGTEEQKQRFLPRLATGELRACFALTEPSSGSDAASIKTKAVLSDDGTHYVLNGSKLWITNAGIANFITLFAKVDEKITCFALELPAQGVTIGPHERKLGLRASATNAIYFENVKIPVENLIGEKGRGFKVAMGVLNHGRLGLAASCIGASKTCLQDAIRHAQERQQFGQKIGDFGIIQEKIANMAADLYAAESLVRVTAGFMDRKDLDYSLETAIAKIFASEVIWRCADESLQILGGNGYMMEYRVQRVLRDARINKIFEGTNEILRVLIALSGIQGPGKALAEVAQALKNPLTGLAPLGQFVGRRARRQVFGISLKKIRPELRALAGQFEKNSALFAQRIESLLRRYGKKIQYEQIAQRRIADIAVDCYAMACILSRLNRAYDEKTPEQVRDEHRIAGIFFARANERVMSNLHGLRRNDDRQVAEAAAMVYRAEGYPWNC